MLVSNIDPDNENCLCPQCLKESNLVEPLKYEDDEEMNLFSECSVHGIFFICSECLEESVLEKCKSYTMDIIKLFYPKVKDEDPELFSSNKLPETFINYEGTFFQREADKEWIGALGSCSMCKKVSYGYVSND